MTRSAAARDPDPADDSVRPATRWVAAGLIPLLVAGFVLLYGLPGRTGQLFAWPIAPTLTAMLLASVSAGGVWFFAAVLRTRRWHTVAAGFPAAAIFMTLLAVATLLHWDRFTHGHVAFWIWTAVCMTAPVVVVGVWLANRRTEAAPRPDEPRLGRWTRRLVVGAAVLSVALGVVLTLVPALVSFVWPWALTPLTSRVLGAVLCLGVAGFAVLHDDRCSALVRMVEVAVVMAVFAAVGVLRAREQIVWNRPLAWVMVVGLGVLLVGGGSLLVRLREPGRIRGIRSRA